MPDLPAKAAKRLAELPPPTWQESIVMAILAVAAVMRCGLSPLHVGPAVAGLLAVATLLASGVVPWEACAGDGKAWDSEESRVRGWR